MAGQLVEDSAATAEQLRGEAGLASRNMVAKLKLRHFHTRRLHHRGAIGHGDRAIDGWLLSCHPRLGRGSSGNDSAPSTGFAEAVKDAVSLSADRRI
jgi:hypothetical protein